MSWILQDGEARQKNRVNDWGNKQNFDKSKNPHACGGGSRLRDD